MVRSNATTPEAYHSQLPLEVIGRVIARTPPDEYIAEYEAARGAGSP